MTHHIIPVLPIMHLVNQDGEPTTTQKLATSTNPPVSKFTFSILCVVQKFTSGIEGKALKMRHQSEKDFWSTFIGIPQRQKGYLIYVLTAQNIVSSHDVVFVKQF